MIVVGSAALGLVWGWWLLLVGGGERPWRAAGLLGGMTLLALLVLWGVWSWPGGLAFLLGTAVGAGVHLAWRQRLRSELKRR